MRISACFELMPVKLLHIFLALSVLYSTAGFTLSKHFCQEKLQGVSLFSKAQSCGHSKTSSCQHHSSRYCDSLVDKDSEGCCKDTTEYFQLDNEKQVQTFGYKPLKAPELLADVSVISKNEPPAFDLHFLSFQTYRPPIVCDDFQSLLQTFRL